MDKHKMLIPINNVLDFKCLRIDRFCRILPIDHLAFTGSRFEYTMSGALKTRGEVTKGLINKGFELCGNRVKESVKREMEGW